MAARTILLLGTRKGAFVVELDPGRQRAAIRGPFCEAMSIQHLAWDTARSALLAGAGRAAVWQSRDEGATWEAQSDGLPQQHAYLGVLREAMAVDRADPVGVYIGTSTGQLFGSRDEGRSWTLLADYLPGISSVETVQLDA